MSHSKRNTSLAFFTSYEREQLKSSWGTARTRLTRDSFLPFSSCILCLLPSRDPVACAYGDIFCRECAISNLLAQRKEIKRLERQAERKAREEAEDGVIQQADEGRRTVEDFEKVQMGLEAKGIVGKSAGREEGKATAEKDVQGTSSNKSAKRKFELDEAEVMRAAREERDKVRKTLSAEKREAMAKSALPSFWAPSQTPGTSTTATHEYLHIVPKHTKTGPLCPGSREDAVHTFSLKTLIALNFTEEKDARSGDPVRSCPSCRKALTNATKAMMAIPCGHVLCKPCASEFLKVDAHDAVGESGVIQCYVCETALMPEGQGKDGTKNDRQRPRPRLVEMKSEGTGFAGGGKNMVEKQGVAFQC